MPGYMVRFVHILHSTTLPRWILCTTILLLLGWGSACSQTVVTTQDGFVFRGKIISRGLDSLKLLTDDGKEISLPHVQVLSIVEEGLPPDPYAYPPPIVLPPSDHPFYGGMLNTNFVDEAVFTLFAGHRMDNFGARFGWSFPKYTLGRSIASGWQFDLLLNLGAYDNATADIYVGIGFETEPAAPNFTLYRRRRFTAFGINANLAGVFVGGGITVGPSDIQDAKFHVHLGLVKEIGRWTMFGW